MYCKSSHVANLLGFVVKEYFWGKPQSLLESAEGAFFLLLSLSVKTMRLGLCKERRVEMLVGSWVWLWIVSGEIGRVKLVSAAC